MITPFNIFPFTKKNIGSSGPAPATQQYYLRTILEDDVSATPERTDGSSFLSYETYALKMFGWGGALIGATAWMRKTTDGGRTWTNLPDAPFVSSEQLCVVRTDGKIWIIDTPDQSVWTYDSTNGFVQVATGGPVVLGAQKILFNDKLIMFGAQATFGGGPTLDRNVYQFNDSTLVWDVIGQTPVDHWSCLGTSWVSGSYIYRAGGGKVNSSEGVYEFLNEKIDRSPDGGVTWEDYATLPEAMRGLWVGACPLGSKVFFIKGWADGINQQGVLYTANNGASWTSFYSTYSYFSQISQRHATSMGVHDNALYIGWGNLFNDLFRIELVTYPTFVHNIVKVYWQRIWPNERPSAPKLTAMNNYVAGCMADTSLNPAVTSNLDELDLLSIFAGLENISQAFMKLKSTNLNFNNQNYNLSGSITFLTKGLKGDGISGAIGPSGPALVGLNWTIDNDGEKFTTQNGSIGIYITDGAFSQYSVIGDSGPTLTNYIVSRENGSNRMYGALNRGDTSVVGPTTAKGFRALTRSAAGTLDFVWAEPGQPNTHDVVSSTAGAYQTTEWTVCGNSNNTNAGSSGETVAIIYLGSQYVDHDKMNVLNEAYLAEVGVIV